MLFHIEQVEESVLSSKKNQTDFNDNSLGERRIS
jgi:hypothetical protein